jgi:hypothetical protein
VQSDAISKSSTASDMQNNIANFANKVFYNKRRSSVSNNVSYLGDSQSAEVKLQALNKEDLSIYQRYLVDKGFLRADQVEFGSYHPLTVGGAVKAGVNNIESTIAQLKASGSGVANDNDKPKFLSKDWILKNKNKIIIGVAGVAIVTVVLVLASETFEDE